MLLAMGLPMLACAQSGMLDNSVDNRKTSKIVNATQNSDEAVKESKRANGGAPTQRPASPKPAASHIATPVQPAAGTASTPAPTPVAGDSALIPDEPVAAAVEASDQQPADIGNHAANEGTPDGGVDEDFLKAPDGYYFTKQIIELKVHRDRTIDVSEYLETNFLERSHGIFRTIPLRFWTKRDVSEAQDGSDLQMRYNAVELDNLEISEEFWPDDLDSLLDIRIGSGDVWVEGRHPYRLSYTLTIPNDDRVDASDLFFHSIVGSGWTCSTDTVYFKVEFDDELPAASLDSLRLFCGPEGDENNKADEVLYYKDGHTLKGCYVGLKSFEAVTMYIPLPDGFFDKGKIPFWSTMAWITAVLTLLVLVYVCFKEMQGDEPVAPVVTFKPSKGLTSADIGSLVDAKVDDIDLLSVIPMLAANGHIVMTPLKDNKTRITRGNVLLPADTPEYVRCIYEGFFLGQEEFFLDKPGRKFGEKWIKAKRLLTSKYGYKLQDDDGLPVIVLLIILFTLTCSFATVPPEGVMVGGMVIFMLVLEALFYGNWKNMMQKITFHEGCAGGCASLLIILAVIVAIPSGAMTYYAGLMAGGDYYLPKSMILGLGIAVALAVLFRYRLRKLSPLRRQHLGEVLGLKDFIMTAEKDRLEMLLKEDERYFYKILPYAMVFGLVNEWAAKFNGLVVAPLAEFGNTSINAMQQLLRSNDMNSFASRSYSAGLPRTSYSSSGRGYSSSGGSYHSSSSHSSRGYSGGGSGGGGGRRW